MDANGENKRWEWTRMRNRARISIRFSRRRVWPRDKAYLYRRDDTFRLQFSAILRGALARERRKTVLQRILFVSADTLIRVFAPWLSAAYAKRKRNGMRRLLPPQSGSLLARARDSGEEKARKPCKPANICVSRSG